MTRNPAKDNEQLSAAYFSADSNALDREAIIDGAAPSAGAGSWDVDIASGRVLVNGTKASIGSQTVTISDASALTSGETRVDLITVDNTGTASATAGTAAADPVAPDIPSGEVLIAVAIVQDGDSSLVGDSIKDYRALLELDAEDLSGEAGTSGQVLTTDGTDGSWSTPTTDATVPTDVSGSRALDTWYQNTQGTAIVVYVLPNGTYTIDVNSSQSANQIVTTDDSFATFVVGDQDYYRVNGVGASGIDSWTEHDLQ